MAKKLYRAGWTYLPTRRKSKQTDMQYEYSEGGEHYICKDGVTYRQAKELGQESRGLEHIWGNHRVFASRINVALQRNAGRRRANEKSKNDE